MESHLKKRLLGAFITVLLIAITLPWLIEHQQKHEEIEVEIPVMPKLPAWSEVKDQQAVRVDLNKLSQSRMKQKQPEVDADKPIQTLDSDEVAESSKTKSKTPFKAWSLKVGAFKETNNAKKLQKRLRQEGFKSYSKRLNGYTRVYVGPEIDKQKIAQAKIRIEKRFKLSALPIIRYQP